MECQEALSKTNTQFKSSVQKNLFDTKMAKIDTLILSKTA